MCLDQALSAFNTRVGKPMKGCDDQLPGCSQHERSGRSSCRVTKDEFLDARGEDPQQVGQAWRGQWECVGGKRTY